MIKTISIFVIFAIVAVFAAPEAKPEPKAKPGVLAYSAPIVAANYFPSAALIERSYHGNGFAYPAAAAYVAASPYIASPYTAAYTAPILVR